MNPININNVTYKPADPIQEEFIRTKYRTLIMDAIRKRGEIVVGNSGIMVQRINHVVIIIYKHIHTYIPLS